jgi:hypothetical protein
MSRQGATGGIVALLSGLVVGLGMVWVALGIRNLTFCGDSYAGAGRRSL